MPANTHNIYRATAQLRTTTPGTNAMQALAAFTDQCYATLDPREKAAIDILYAESARGQHRTVLHAIESALEPDDDNPPSPTPADPHRRHGDLQFPEPCRACRNAPCTCRDPADPYTARKPNR
jgi:hypothetical protein